jgi:phosphoribosylformimino-5-aminoimidazole carboxamide ribotide isomerase
MYIFPAIDLYEGKAVRLYKGDYNEMTVYSERPWEIAEDFYAKGARHIHIVDLEGAKDGTTPNIEIVKKIIDAADLFVEIGGGIRNMDTVKAYVDAGVDRVILGTAAVKDEEFLRAAVAEYGDKIAVGIDLKDGYVAIKGWTETSAYTGFEFCEKMEKMGVSCVICTDISKDGAMQGTNHELYREMSRRFKLDITASGGVSSIEDVIKLNRLGIYGAIIGKAYYTGAISLSDAVAVTKGGAV